MKIARIFFRHPLLLASLVLLLVLVWRSPLAESSTLGNLEPFPDTIYYLKGAEGIATRGSLSLWREGQEILNPVPVIYPLVLAPIFWFSSDPRWFYLINVLLAATSVALFYFLLKQTVSSTWIRTLVLLLFVLTPALSWYPQFAMAENLLLPIFLASFLLLTLPVTKKRLLTFGLLTSALLAVKTATAPLVLLLLLSYGVKLVNLQTQGLKSVVTLLLSAFTFRALFIFLEAWLKGVPLISSSLFSPGFEIDSFALDLFSGTRPLGVQIPLFRQSYLRPNLELYLKPFVDYPALMLGSPVPVISPLLGTLVALSLLVNVLLKPRFIAWFNLVISGVSLLFFSSFFYVDFRHLYYLLPVYYVSLGIFLVGLTQYLGGRPYWRVLHLSALLLVIASLGILSLKHLQESPQNLRPDSRNFQAVMAANNFFSEHEFNQRTPILLTVLPPHYVDLFKTAQFQLLPLSSLYYFTPDPQLLYGQHNFDSLTDLYRQKILEGHLIYLQDYFDVYHFEFKRDAQFISRNFKLEKVYEGCGGSCDLYSLGLND